MGTAKAKFDRKTRKGRRYSDFLMKGHGLA
jgi:hypothetical protein